MPGGLNDGGAKLLQLPAPGATVRSPQRPHPQPGMSFHAIRTCKVDQGAGGKEPTCKSKSTSRGVNKKTSCSGPNVKPLLDNSRTVFFLFFTGLTRRLQASGTAPTKPPPNSRGTPKNKANHARILLLRISCHWLQPYAIPSAAHRPSFEEINEGNTWNSPEIRLMHFAVSSDDRWPQTEHTKESEALKSL